MHATGSERLSVYEEMLDYASYMQHFPPVCEATKGWQMLEWMEASDPVEPRRKVVGQGERESWEGKKVMVLALSSAPLLQSPRQHAWRALKRGVITGKNNGEAGSEWELTTAKLERELREGVGSRSTTDFIRTQRSVNLTFRDSAKKRNEHSFIIGGHSD